jgi:hypothetical protein
MLYCEKWAVLKVVDSVAASRFPFQSSSLDQKRQIMLEKEGCRGGKSHGKLHQEKWAGYSKEVDHIRKMPILLHWKLNYAILGSEKGKGSCLIPQHKRIRTDVSMQVPGSESYTTDLQIYWNKENPQPKGGKEEQRGGKKKHQSRAQ